MNWILAAFFAVGAFANITASGQAREEYQRWGYPEWFHYVTGTLELAVAVFLVFPATRLAGYALGVVVMGAATTTLLFHAEYFHALAPLIVLTFISVNAWLNLRRR